MIRRARAWVRFLAAVLGAGLMLSAAPGDAVAQRDEPYPRWLTFQGAFAGVTADGQSCVWDGSVEGATRGRLRVELRQVEGPAAAASPVWHVVTRWSVEDPTGGRSFEAELEGMVDWKTGVMRLSGVITKGWMQGVWVEQEGRFVNGDATGSLAISPRAAAGLREGR